MLDIPSLIEALLVENSAHGKLGHLLTLAAWQRDEARGVKLVTVFPDNAKSALPTIAGAPELTTSGTRSA